MDKIIVGIIIGIVIISVIIAFIPDKKNNAK